MAQSKAHKRSTRVLASAEFSEHRKEPSTTSANNMNFGTSSTMVMSSAGGGNAIRRVRTPHAHDVLSGRGGGINAHQGNVQFRLFVRARKDDYNLAKNKMEKTQVAQEVIDIVRSLDPPGRFLQKDPSYGGLGGWWVELDEDKVMAKTSQALREGAPLIRAAHKSTTTSATTALQSKPPMPPLVYASQEQEQEQQQPQYIPMSAPTSPLLSGRKTNKRYIDPDTCVSTITKPDEAAMTARQELAMAELRANVEQARNESNNIDSLHHLTMPPLVTEEPEENVVQQHQQSHGAHVKQYSPFKRVRVQYGGRFVHPGAQSTPPLTSSADAAAEMIQVPPLDLSKVVPAARPLKKYRRSHSLALSDTSLVDHSAEEDFVNPFEEDGDEYCFGPTTSSPDVETSSQQQPTYNSSSNNNHLGTVPLDTLNHASSAESSAQSASLLRPGFYRNSSSTTSNGDLAGLRSLMQPSSTDNSSRSLSASSGVRGYASGSSSKWDKRDSFDDSSTSSEELDLTDPLHYFFCQTRSDGILSPQ
jgi:hypothetical protein